jgi:hypothetical protein
MHHIKGERIVWARGGLVEFGACPTCEGYEPVGEVRLVIRTPAGPEIERRCVHCRTVLTHIFPVLLPCWVAEEAIRSQQALEEASPAW